MVRSEHVRTFFHSTQSQQSKSEVCAQEFYAAMRIKTYLDNALYLSSLLSDLSIFKANHQIINDRLYMCTVFFLFFYWLYRIKVNPPSLLIQRNKIRKYLNKYF